MIVETKVGIPVIRTCLIPRPKLHDRLNRGLDCKLTLITAPSGYGKTTLLSEWASHIGMPVGWLTMDADDDRPHRFWKQAADSLRQAYPVLGEQEGGRHMLRYAGEDESAAAHLLNALARLPRKKVLVWDDFHLIRNPVILTDIVRFIKFLPRNVHLYVISRSHPPLQLSKLRASGELNEIGRDDLRFSKEECALFVSACHELELTDRQLDTLHRKTEGWIAGIRLAALAIGRSGNREAALKELTGRSKEYMEYYFDEIMGHLDEPLQQFLYRTSVLELLNGELCEAVAGIANSSEWLRRLEQMNLFVVPLDKRQEWYRYHQLFRQFLQMQLRLQEPERVPELHRAAGRWMEAGGHAEKAMEHYLSARSYEEAVRLLDEMTSVSANWGWDELVRWMEHIPERLLVGYPRLFLLFTIALFMSGRPEEAKKRLVRIKRVIAEGGGGPLAGTIGLYRKGNALLQALSAYMDRDFAASIRYSQDYVQLDPDASLFDSIVMNKSAICSLRDVYVRIGSLKTAEVLLRRYLQVWSRSRNALVLSELALAYGKLMYEWDNIDQARRYATQAQELAEAAGNAAVKVEAGLLLARIDLTESGDLRAADVACAAAEGLLGEAERCPYLSVAVQAGVTELRLMQGEVGKAEEWLLACGLQTTDEIPPVMMRPYQIFAALLAAKGSTDEAACLLGKIRSIARQEDNRGEEIRCIALHSLVCAKEKSAAQSLNLIEEALALAEPDGYVRVFTDNGRPMRQLLEQYLHSRQSHHRAVAHKVSLYYVKRLLQHMRGRTEGRQPEGSEGEEAVRWDDLLTDKEMTVLRMIHEGLSNKRIAERLRISLSTVKTHINNLYKKLGVGNRVLAVEQAKRRGLLERQDFT